MIALPADRHVVPLVFGYGLPLLMFIAAHERALSQVSEEPHDEERMACQAVAR